MVWRGTHQPIISWAALAPRGWLARSLNAMVQFHDVCTREKSVYIQEASRREALGPRPHCVLTREISMDRQQQGPPKNEGG